LFKVILYRVVVIPIKVYREPPVILIKASRVVRAYGPILRVVVVIPIKASRDVQECGRILRVVVILTKVCRDGEVVLRVPIKASRAVAGVVVILTMGFLVSVLVYGQILLGVVVILTIACLIRGILLGHILRASIPVSLRARCPRTRISQIQTQMGHGCS
jgi:hypothetical protein